MTYKMLAFSIREIRSEFFINSLDFYMALEKRFGKKSKNRPGPRVSPARRLKFSFDTYDKIEAGRVSTIGKKSIEQLAQFFAELQTEKFLDSAFNLQNSRLKEKSLYQTEVLERFKALQAEFFDLMNLEQYLLKTAQNSDKKSLPFILKALFNNIFGNKNEIESKKNTFNPDSFNDRLKNIIGDDFSEEKELRIYLEWAQRISRLLMNIYVDPSLSIAVNLHLKQGGICYIDPLAIYLFPTRFFRKKNGPKLSANAVGFWINAQACKTSSELIEYFNANVEFINGESLFNMSNEAMIPETQNQLPIREEAYRQHFRDALNQFRRVEPVITDNFLPRVEVYARQKAREKNCTEFSITKGENETTYYVALFDGEKIIDRIRVSEPQSGEHCHPVLGVVCKRVERLPMEYEGLAEESA